MYLCALFHHFLGKSCSALPPIQDGLLIPAFCAVTGNFFNQSCQYSCNQGYSLNGISSRTCQANAEWDFKAIPKCDKGKIDLVTVFEATLTSRQTCEKLQCLYENLMSNNFRKTAALNKI